MKKDYTITMSEEEYNDLLAILAYTSKLVDYKPGDVQHKTIAGNAAKYWHQIVESE